LLRLVCLDTNLNMMKTLYLLLTAMVSLVCANVSAQQLYDIRFLLDDIDCETGQTCYNVQIKSGDGQVWNLAGQNYRIFYDASTASYISGSVTSELPAAQYSAPLVTSDQQDVDASGFPGDLPFSATLSFFNYSIDLMNLSSGGINLPADGEWMTTSRLCFDVPQSALEDGSECLNLVWARMGRTDEFATAFVEISQWISTNNTAEAIGNVFDDLDENDGDQACLTATCDPTAGGNENTTTTCSDNLDNDNDGLVDCADDSCADVSPCRPDENTYDINLALSSVDCFTGTACYDVQLMSSGNADFTLGDQNYRLFYNSEVGSFTSVVSRLDNAFQPATLSNGTPIENQNAAGVGDLDFDDDLGFVDFSINLVSQNAGSDEVISTNSFTTTAEICFVVSEEAIANGDVCFETAWARTELTGVYNPSELEVEEWVNASETRELAPTSFNDLSSSSGNAACFNASCDSPTEVGSEACQDGMDNDNDGLVDCLDPNCSEVAECANTCAAQAPVLTGN